MSAPLELVTVEEYLRREAVSVDKHEFHNGRIQMMAGGDYRHSLIIANIVGELRNSLKGKPCRVSESNTRVSVASRRSYMYPDATVVCGGPVYDPLDVNKTTIVNPTLVVEVLSKGTEHYDRGDKFYRFSDLASLKEYVLVNTRTARVETYHRRDDDTWVLSWFDGLEASAHFASIDVTIPLAEIYDGVELPPEDESGMST